MSDAITNDKGGMLHFTGHVSLGDLGEAAKAYSALINALEDREPSWQEFCDFLLREGYVSKDKPN